MPDEIDTFEEEIDLLGIERDRYQKLLENCQDGEEYRTKIALLENALLSIRNVTFSNMVRAKGKAREYAQTTADAGEYAHWIARWIALQDTLEMIERYMEPLGIEPLPETEAHDVTL